MSNKLPMYPVSTIAKLFNLSERRIQQLAKEGVIPKADRCKYELVGSVRGYTAYLQERALGQETKTTDIQTQRYRLIKAQADEKELELQKKRDQLIPSEDVKAGWSRIVIATKTGFLALPDRLKQMLTLTDAERDVIDDEVRIVLTNLAEKKYHLKETEHNPKAETNDVDNTQPT